MASPMTLPSALKRIGAPILFALFVFCAFSPVRHHGPFAIDDAQNLHLNPYFNPVTPKSLVELWQHPYQGLYIPVTYTLWGLQTLLARADGHPAPDDPARTRAYHTANLLFH